MSPINFDIVLYNSPFFENLVNEFHRISKYKRNIYKKIRNEEEYSKKLSNEERIILKDLSDKENKILLEILANKQWLTILQKEPGGIFPDLQIELSASTCELLESVNQKNMF
ncbi:MAG: hypothetical protein WCZ90_11390 [Melioribacteraceae bacterium]